MYRISGNLVEEIGSKGQKVYKIASVDPRGIRVYDEADNGAEIVRIIPFTEIKK